RETAHELSDRHAHNGPTSEHIQVVAPASPADPARIEYFYPTPPAPVTAEFAAGVWVKANRSGVQFGARVVLPRERNPERPTEPLTDFLPGDRYQLRGSWQRLELPRPAQLLRDRQQALRIRLGRDVDITGAYVDRLILNLYTGPGQTDVFIDD